MRALVAGAVLLAGCATTPTASAEKRKIVIVAEGDGAAASREALRQRLGPEVLVDASEVAAELRSDGHLPLNDFKVITRRLPSTWPPPLVKQWDRGMTVCRELVGPLPWKGTAGSVFAYCSQGLTAWLWNEYLTYVGATHVYQLSSRLGDRVVIEATTYAVGEVQERIVSRTAPPPLVAEVIKNMLEDLFEGRGTPQSRVVSLQIGTELAEPYTDAPISSTTVEITKKCDQLPARLEVTPASTLGRSVEELWKTSAAGGGAAVGCTLKSWVGKEAVTGESVLASLDCGPVHSAGVVLRSLGPERLAAKLVKGLAERTCDR